LSFLFSNSNRNVVLLPYPASIRTIPGRYPLSKLRSIKAKASSGFFLNSMSFFPPGKELACWYNSISNGRLFLPSYRWVVTAYYSVIGFPNFSNVLPPHSRREIATFPMSWVIDD
jgi:hypothetical protein